jgi:hypothetical protein
LTATPTPNIEQRVGQFITLRDKIKAMNDAHKEKMKPYVELMETLSGVLLQHLQAMSADSVASKSGTVYRTVKNTASIADGEAFWQFLVDNNAWDLLDKKANVTAVQDFIEQHQTPPPGVNFTSVMTVGVRRK